MRIDMSVFINRQIASNTIGISTLSKEVSEIIAYLNVLKQLIQMF